jgi:hypothetical protein
MELTYSFKNAKDLLAKLKRDFEALNDQVTGDRFFNLIITAYHIKDWIINDHSLTTKIRANVKSLADNKYFAMCHDIANASKHLILKYPPKTNSAVSNQGWGYGRWGKGLFGVGEESIEIEWSDGTKIDALELSKEILLFWETFFLKNNI